MKQGFTLIELLVVVLIIGILAAIAVPQYQKAVFKSKTRQILSLVRGIANAEEAYFLAHGSYTPNYDDLDINVQDTSDNCQPLSFSQESQCKSIGDWNVYIALHGNTGQEVPKSIEAQYQDIIRISSYLENYRYQNQIRMDGGYLTCVVLKTAGNDLCQSLGGTKIASGYYRL